MKSLRLLVALSALLVVGSTAAQAQVYGGRVVLPAAEPDFYNPPIGINETGRYVRFVTDPRFQEQQIQMTNRDFENWKPLDVRSKEKMMHFMRGSLRTSNASPVPDQETGRFMRFVVDNRLDYNNVNMENRDFQNFKVNGAESKTFMLHYLHGLPTGRGYVMPRSLAIRGVSAPLRWY